MKYAIQINSGPTQSNNGYVAYRFIQTLIKQDHKIFRVFFYHDGIYHAFKQAIPPDDEIALTKLWSELAHQNQVDLVVCISAAQRRGLLQADESARRQKLDNDLADGFRISGLGQLAEAILMADRFIIFH